MGLDRRYHDDTHFLAGTSPASSVPDYVVLVDRLDNDDGIAKSMKAPWTFESLWLVIRMAKEL